MKLFCKKEIQKMTDITDSEWTDLFRHRAIKTFTGANSGTGTHRMLTLKEVCAVWAAIMCKRTMHDRTVKFLSDILEAE